MSEKKPKQLVKTIGGVEYTFQFPGVRKAVQISDASKDRFGNIKSEALYDQLMEHVIVLPKTNWDYWDDRVEDMEEVFGTAFRFLNRVPIE